MNSLALRILNLSFLLCPSDPRPPPAILDFPFEPGVNFETRLVDGRRGVERKTWLRCWICGLGWEEAELEAEGSHARARGGDGGRGIDAAYI